MADQTWTADRRIYLDADGHAVEAHDKRRARLLVAKGGTLPIDTARALGLLEPPAPPAVEEAPTAAEGAEEKARAAPANKLRAPPAANRAAPPRKR